MVSCIHVVLFLHFLREVEYDIEVYFLFEVFLGLFMTVCSHVFLGIFILLLVGLLQTFEHVARGVLYGFLLLLFNGLLLEDLVALLDQILVLTLNTRDEILGHLLLGHEIVFIEERNPPCFPVLENI